MGWPYPFRQVEVMGSREIRIQQLFDAMRSAERTKDIDPQGYVKARIAYYKVAEGDQWISKETDRLRAEADETVSRWRSKYTTLQSLRDAHRSNLDAIRAADASQVDLQQDVSYALQELKKLISNDTDQALLKEREAYFRVAQRIPSWVPTTLDVLITVLLFYALYATYTILGPRWSASSYLIASERLKALRERLQPGLPGRTPGSSFLPW